MTTKNPRDKMTWANIQERARVAEFLQREYGSISAGLRAALNLLLKKHKQSKLDEMKWGGDRRKTKDGE